MTKSKAQLLLAALVVIALVAGSAPKATAAKDATFTVLVQSAFLRSGPGLGYPRVYSVKQGQVFVILGRNADASWLRLDFAGATSDAWVMAAFGKVDGDANALPELAATGADADTPPSTGGSETRPYTPSPTRIDYTVLVKSAFARSAPSFSAPRVYSVFKGQTYRVLARSADDVWLQIDFPNAASEVWMVAAYGSLSGDLGAVPVYASPGTGGSETRPYTPSPGAAATASPNPPVPGPVIVVGSRASGIYQYGLALGNNPRRFSKVGDCNSVNPYFLTSFDVPQEYRLGGPYVSLQETVRNFSGSFSRESLATHVGFAAASVLDPTWANGKVCKPGENALECEYRLNHPSLAIISLGTNSVWQAEADYEASLRRVVEFFINHGVVPILSTKADNLEGEGRFNSIVVRLAKEYDVPLWNFRGAVEGAPNYGLTEDGFHLVWGRSFFTSADSVQTGWQWRNLTALQALDAVWRAVKK